mmetsp:Transcript_17149/g.26505  ORF Transcript_17149/g.26505 Transcript_17149/m.26505 type:complete len:108 (+) Transcript_17149:722-1045(+)
MNTHFTRPSSSQPDTEGGKALKSKDTIVLKGELGELFKYWQLRRNFIFGGIVFAFCTFSYYLINFEVKYMKGSMVRNTLISQAAEFLSTLGGGLIYYALGVRYGLSS